MTNAYDGFDKRLRRIGRTRARMARGYTSKVSKDGLIVFRPGREKRSGFPLKGLLLLVFGFFCFKALIIAHLGETVFTQRVSTLATGSVIEQGGAFMMQADPVSLTLAQYVRPLVQ